MLEPQPRVNLHGKGDKWRTCPLWPETARLLREVLDEDRAVWRRTTRSSPPGMAARSPGSGFTSSSAGTRRLWVPIQVRPPRRISPHVLRHTTAVHLLEAGVEINVIRGWLGHVSLDTTHRYAEINIRMKEAALQACTPPMGALAGFPEVQYGGTTKPCSNGSPRSEYYVAGCGRHPAMSPGKTMSGHISMSGT